MLSYLVECQYASKVLGKVSHDILLAFWKELCPGSFLPSTVLWQTTLKSTGVLQMLTWYQTSEDAHVHSARPPSFLLYIKSATRPNYLFDSLIA